MCKAAQVAGDMHMAGCLGAPRAGAAIGRASMAARLSLTVLLRLFSF